MIIKTSQYFGGNKMATQKQKIARDRNFNKFRLKGMKQTLRGISTDDDCMTRTERKRCKNMSAEISELLRMWRSKI